MYSCFIVICDYLSVLVLTRIIDAVSLITKLQVYFQIKKVVWRCCEITKVSNQPIIRFLGRLVARFNSMTFTKHPCILINHYDVWSLP